VQGDGRAFGAIVGLTAGFALLLHLAVAGRYGFFRDELYFIACGRHPDFGYVDQPPLVPLLAAATQVFGHHLALLRAVPALAAAGCVAVACAIARTAGGGRFAVALAGIAVATAPMYVGIDGTLNTSAFEPLAWTALSYFAIRAAVRSEPRALVWAGAVVGVALEAKYQIVFYAVPLVAAMLVTRARSLLRTREAAAGFCLAVVLAAPSIVWQWQHAFPFVELLRAGASGKNAVYAPVSFVVNQAMVMNVIFAPVWIAGVVAALAAPRLARLRFLGIAFVLTFAEMLLLHAKDYYVAGLYAGAFAVGATTIERALRPTALRAAYVALGVAFAALSWPNALPLLDPPQMARYLDTLAFLRPQEQEKGFRGELIPQNLADQLGWQELARDVARVYDGLAPTERAHAAIFARNYGEAGALDFYGPAYGLPPAISSHNQYWLWGTHGYDGSVVIRVNSDDIGWWTKHCHDAHVAGTFGANPYLEPYERNAPIIVCHGLYRPLGDDWAEFKSYG